MEATQVCYNSAWLQRLLKAILVFSYLLFLYYQLVGHTIWALELMALSFFGLLLGTMWVVRYGEKGAQTRFENGTGIILGPGIHFQWNLFPPVRDFMVTLGLGVQIIEDRYPDVRSRDDRLHHLDTRDVRVDVRLPNLFSLLTYNIARWLFSFLFNFKDEGGRYMYYKIGRLISIIAFILGLIANSQFPDTAQKSSIWSSFPLFGTLGLAKAREAPEGYVITSARLSDGAEPIMPTREDFVPMPYEKETQRFIRINGDQRKYFLFHEPELGKSHVLKVTETLCQIIPAGREMLFILQHPPSYALNMEKKIEYIPKKRIRRFFYEQYQKITGGDPYSYLIDFRDIRKQWEEVDYTNYAIKVRALPNSALHKSSKGHGGVVCF